MSIFELTHRYTVITFFLLDDVEGLLSQIGTHSRTSSIVVDRRPTDERRNRTVIHHHFLSSNRAFNGWPDRLKVVSLSSVSNAWQKYACVCTGQKWITTIVINQWPREKRERKSQGVNTYNWIARKKNERHKISSNMPTRGHMSVCAYPLTDFSSRCPLNGTLKDESLACPKNNRSTRNVIRFSNNNLILSFHLYTSLLQHETSTRRNNTRQERQRKKSKMCIELQLVIPSRGRIKSWDECELDILIQTNSWIVDTTLRQICKGDWTMWFVVDIKAQCAIVQI